MNGKLLIKQNRELFDKLQIANLNCRRLTEENQSLKLQIQNLTEQLAAKNEKSSESVNETVTEEEIQERVDIEESIELSPEIEYGSKIIGEIVISATQHSNLLGNCGKENLKELLNLILGRTEVAKSEILNIVSSEVSLDNKMQMIDSVRDEAIEYFKSIMEQ